jgi:pantetheine-phosphate adenylyltransferase
MPRIGLFPGTFDPVTIGHVDILERARSLFDQLIIGIGVNSAKQPMFPLEKRMQWCRDMYRDDPGISVESYEGLTVDFCRRKGAAFIIRGLRSVGDLEYERPIAAMNSQIAPGIETIFLTASPACSMVASTLVRDILKFGGDASMFLPQVVRADLNL